jgi:hypothetical protein
MMENKKTGLQAFTVENKNPANSGEVLARFSTKVQ